MKRIALVVLGLILLPKVSLATEYSCRPIGLITVSEKTEKVSGYVRGKDIILGTSGNVNKIRLWVGEYPTGPYTVRTVLCARSNTTLGWCDPVVVGDFIVASGDGYNLEGDLYPVTYIGIKEATLP